jgi:hypothetical protein
VLAVYVLDITADALERHWRKPNNRALYGNVPKYELYPGEVLERTSAAST